MDWGNLFDAFDKFLKQIYPQLYYMDEEEQKNDVFTQLNYCEDTFEINKQALVIWLGLNKKNVTNNLSHQNINF